MKRKKRMPGYRIALGFALFFTIPGILLIVIGSIKSADFRKTEKIKMTFTEPVVSVSGHTDSNDSTVYTMRVEYEYNGEKRIHSFTKSRKYTVGETVTFTKYFTTDGTEIEDNGKTMSAFGFLCLGLSLPWDIILIMEIRDRIRKKTKTKSL